MIHRDTLLARVEGLDSLPTLPAIVLRIQRAFADPEVSVREITRIIESDPPLSGQLLRIANSAMYAPSERIASVKRAVTALGLAETRQVCVAAAVIDRFSSIGSGDARGFWRHSLAVARTASVVAKFVGLPATTSGAVYTGGLLHDMGRLAMAHWYPKGYGALADRAVAIDQPLDEFERSQLGIDHAELGARIAEHWKLPARVVSILRHHHSPARAPELNRRICATTHLANRLCHLVGLGGAHDPTPSLEEITEESPFDQTPDGWADLLVAVNEVTRGISRFVDEAVAA